jgi:hypothetical protein
MAESSGESGANLSPQPQFEIPKQGQGGQESTTERALEKHQVSETAPTKQTPKFPAPPVPATPPPLQQQAQPTDQTQAQQPAPTSGLQAQDTDLIEKEWVQRAKKIIEHTQDDPFKQKSEMNKIKADYIKKRFNKSIPLDDSSKK